MKVRTHEIAGRPGVARIASSLFSNWKDRRRARHAAAAERKASFGPILFVSASAMRTASRLDQ